MTFKSQIRLLYIWKTDKNCFCPGSVSLMYQELIISISATGKQLPLIHWPYLQPHKLTAVHITGSLHLIIMVIGQTSWQSSGSSIVLQVIESPCSGFPLLMNLMNIANFSTFDAKLHICPYNHYKIVSLLFGTSYTIDY